MGDWPVLIWFLSLFPKPKRYRIVEDDDEVGYWFEEIDDE